MDIHDLRRDYPGKTDREIAREFVNKHRKDYRFAVGYTNDFATSDSLTDIGFCDNSAALSQLMALKNAVVLCDASSEDSTEIHDRGRPSSAEDREAPTTPEFLDPNRDYIGEAKSCEGVGANHQPAPPPLPDEGDERTWYLAESVQKSVQQVVLVTPTEPEGRSSDAREFMPSPDALMRLQAANWGAAVMQLPGSSSEGDGGAIVLVKASDDLLSTLRGQPVCAAFAFYSMRAGGLFQVFVQATSPEVERHTGTSFIVEAAYFLQEVEDRELLEGLLGGSKLRLRFVHSGESVGLSIRFELEFELTHECREKCMQEWTGLVRHHSSVSGPNAQSCLDQYNAENPVDLSPVLPAPPE